MPFQFLRRKDPKINYYWTKGHILFYFIYIVKALSFVYPNGATLNVAKPAVPVLSSGSVSFPLNRPVCAFYTHRGHFFYMCKALILN